MACPRTSVIAKAPATLPLIGFSSTSVVQSLQPSIMLHPCCKPLLSIHPRSHMRLGVPHRSRGWTEPNTARGCITFLRPHPEDRRHTHLPHKALWKLVVEQIYQQLPAPNHHQYTPAWNYIGHCTVPYRTSGCSPATLQSAALIVRAAPYHPFVAASLLPAWWQSQGI